EGLLSASRLLLQRAEEEEQQVDQVGVLGPLFKWREYSIDAAREEVELKRVLDIRRIDIHKTGMQPTAWREVFATYDASDEIALAVEHDDTGPALFDFIEVLGQKHTDEICLTGAGGCHNMVMGETRRKLERDWRLEKFDERRACEIRGNELLDIQI